MKRKPFRTPSKGYLKKKGGILKEWFHVLDVTIPNLLGVKQAQEIDYNLYLALKSGMINEAEFHKYHSMILEVCKENNWTLS